VDGHLLPAQQTEEYINGHKEIKAKLAKKKDYDREGKILVRDGSGDYAPYTIPNMANAGEDGG
jgi:hypothetical protein